MAQYTCTDDGFKKEMWKNNIKENEKQKEKHAG